MKLFLASEAKNPKSLKNLDEYVNGLKGKSIAYIPTAANGESWQGWKNGESWKMVQTLGANISLIQLEDYQNKNPIKDLIGKNIIWFAGGYAGYLLYWMRRTQLDKNLKSILDNDTVYVGSSAGSMITGPSMDYLEWYIGENEHGAGCIPGLNLVDFTFYPHYKEEYFDKIKNKSKDKKTYLVKDGETIIVEDQKIKVLGKERLLESN